MTQTVVVKPPSALLTPCEKPVAGKLETNEDLAVFTSQVISAWEKCAAKIDALREYFDLVEEN